MAEPPPLSRMIILHYTKEKKYLGITLFGAKKYECRAKPRPDRLCADELWQNFFNFFAVQRFLHAPHTVMPSSSAMMERIHTEP